MNQEVYDVNVWYTKPDFYRVKVTQQGEDVTQMIVRNKEGVFVAILLHLEKRTSSKVNGQNKIVDRI
ncbi:hypothetical protein UACE39S_05981 [Ureibacillus acetophenoni]